MRKILSIIIILLFIPLMTNAQILSNNGLFGTKKTPPPKAPQTTNNTGVAGSGTQVNINTSEKYQPPEPGMMDSGWEEADFYVSLSTMPAIALSQPSDPQFMTTPNDALEVSVIYNFAPRMSIWLKYVEIEAKGVRLETEVETLMYDENGDPLYNDDGTERTQLEQVGYDTTWQHRRLFWGLSWRFNFGENNSNQAQIGIGTSLYDEIKESESGREVSGLDTTILLDAKYLWVTHNAAWGVQVTSVHTGSKEKDIAKRMSGGYLWIGLVYIQGFEGLN